MSQYIELASALYLLHALQLQAHSVSGSEANAVLRRRLKRHLLDDWVVQYHHFCLDIQNSRTGGEDG